MASNYYNIEYEIEKKFIKGFRAVFEKDDEFKFDLDEKLNQIKVTTDYPEDENAPCKIPHIVITDIAYQLNVQNFFGYNFYSDKSANGMDNGSQQYAQVIPYSATIVCTGGKSISKDLANKVQWYLSFAAAHYFNEELGLSLLNISKSRTSPSKQFPEKVFDTPISISGTLYWLGVKGPENVLGDIDQPLHDINIKFKK